MELLCLNKIRKLIGCKSRLKLACFGVLCFSVIGYITGICVYGCWSIRAKCDFYPYWFIKGGKQRMPQCIIIGARKSGTGALRQFLGLHPDIRVTRGREPNFFSHHYENGFDWYRRRMPYSLKGQLTVEKSSNYFQDSNTPKKIYNMNKDVKLILIVRDPVDRAISDFTQRKLANKTSSLSFDKAVIDRAGNVRKTHISLVSSFYYKLLQNWLMYFPLNQIHIVDGESFKLHPYDELYKIETFLGLSHKLPKDQFVFNPRKGFYCYKTSKMRCMRENKGRKHVKVSNSTKSRLRKYFKPLNEVFFRQIRRRFNWTVV